MAKNRQRKISPILTHLTLARRHNSAPVPGSHCLETSSFSACFEFPGGCGLERWGNSRISAIHGSQRSAKAGELPAFIARVATRRYRERNQRVQPISKFTPMFFTATNALIDANRDVRIKDGGERSACRPSRTRPETSREFGRARGRTRFCMFARPMHLNHSPSWADWPIRL